MTTPTAAQLKAANLIQVNTWEEIDAAIINEQGPLRTFNGKNFPPVTSGYVTAPKGPAILKYTVTFGDTQGQTFPPLSVAAGATFIIPAGPTNAPTGEVFAGWGDGEFAYQPGQTYTMPAKNVDLEALFTPVTPPVTPPVNPTSIPMTPVGAGMTRALSATFTGTLDQTKWTAPYSGVSGGTASGLFIPQHTIVEGGYLHLQAYPDPTNIVKSFGYTPELAASVNQWGGAGIATLLEIGPGSLTRVCMKFDVYPGIAPMAIFFGDKTEIDWAEVNDISTKGQKITQIFGSVHYSNHSQSSNGIPINAPSGVDFSQLGVFGVQWTTTGLIFTYSSDGVNYVETGSYTFTQAELASDVLTPQNLCLQIQTGDVMPNPPADPSVTASNPVQLLVDWVTVDVAA